MSTFLEKGAQKVLIWLLNRRKKQLKKRADRVLLQTADVCFETISRMKEIEKTMQSFEAYQDPAAYEQAGVISQDNFEVASEMCFEVDDQVILCLGLQCNGTKYWTVVFGESQIRSILLPGKDLIEQSCKELLPFEKFTQAGKLSILAREIMASPKAVKPQESACFARLLIARTRQNLDAVAQDLRNVYGEAVSQLRKLQREL